MLRDNGIDVAVHDDMFSPDTPDEVWIVEVADSGLVAVTRDLRIARNAIQLHAVHASGLRLVSLTGGSISTEMLALNFLNAVPSIERFLAKHQGPLIARLARPASVEDIRTGGHGQLRMNRSRVDLRERFETTRTTG